MKTVHRLTKVLILAAFALYLWTPGIVSPTVTASDLKCPSGFVCEGGGTCDCPIANCTGCFVRNGQPACGNCAGNAFMEVE